MCSGHLSEVTQHDIAPQYPWPYPELDAELREPYVAGDKGDLGTGFDGENITTDLRAVVDLLINTTIDLNAFHVNHEGAPPEWELALRRNFTHYQLYLLPRFGSTLYRICRLTLLIYSDFILFPIAFPDIRLRLCSHLQSILQHEHIQLRPDLYVWFIVMGALASIDTPYDDWYVSMLSLCFTSNGFGEWVLLKATMKRFLWWECVLDPRVYYLCHEAWAVASVHEVG